MRVGANKNTIVHAKVGFQWELRCSRGLIGKSGRVGGADVLLFR